jgi:hypothetical protein
MRDIKLSGREAAVVRAIGFAESMLGAEILDSTRMEPEDVGEDLVQRGHVDVGLGDVAALHPRGHEDQRGAVDVDVKILDGILG